MKQLNILGSGWYVPSKKVTNDDLSNIMDTSHEWIASRTGIHNRHISENQTTVDLAYEAARTAISNAKISETDIDLILVATMTPDHFTPSVACLVQSRLGLDDSHVMALDVNAACSGFLYAIHLASSMLASGEHQCALVIGAEVMSKLLDWNDRSTSILFGDGAGAMILSTKQTTHSIAIKHRSHISASKGDKELVLAAPMMEPRSCFEPQQLKQRYLSMNGPEVFRFAIDAMSRSINEVTNKAGVDIDEVDLIVPHQANSRIIQSVVKKFQLNEEKVFVNLQDYGNTSAASIAIAFAQLQSQERIHSDMKLILVGFGAGFTWGALYLEL